MTGARGDERPLRLLYVAARFLPFVGGTEVHTAEVATRLARRGHQVTVLTTDTTRTMPRSQEMDGVEVLRMPAWPRQRDYYVAPGLAGIVGQRRWDLVHIQGYHTAVAPLSMIASARAGLPYVVTFHSGGHSSQLRRSLRPVQQVLMRPLLRRAAALVGVSDFETSHFAARLRLPRSQFETIPNGTSFTAATAIPAVPNLETVICSVGRLERYKGHDRVIAAMPHLRRLLPDARLRIVGRGPDAERLERFARQCGVEDAVEFTSVPSDQRDRMANLLSEAAVVVLLSDYESQGMAIYEALAVGRPVLVSDRAALGELATKIGLRAVPPRTPAKELATIILQVARTPATHDQPKLAEWEEIAEALESLYRTVLQGGRRPAS